MAAKWSSMIPDRVKGRVAAAGEAGSNWLLRLDDMISELEERWDIKVTGVLDGGSHAFIGLAGDKVLKIDIPDEQSSGFANGAEVLRAANGEGYCRLYKFDGEMCAMLIERLGEPLRLSALTPNRQMEIICAAIRKSWEIPVQSLRYANIGDYLWFRSFIPEAYRELGKPCSDKVIDKALDYIGQLEKRTDPDKYVLVHGDAHNNNMLRVPGTDSYKFIDPDGLIFEKSYDVGVLMREWPDEYMADPLGAGLERAEFLEKLTEVDRHDIWKQGYLQMVATALILMQIGDAALARQMLDIAECWTRHP